MRLGERLGLIVVRVSSSAERVEQRLDELIDALRAHAAAMIANGDPPEVMPSINRLRHAALDYVDAVFKHTQWGNVFAGLYEDSSLPRRLGRRLPGRDKIRFQG